MGLGVIVVIGAERDAFGSIAPQATGRDTLPAEPLACVEILGRSIIDRVIERFARTDAKAVTVLVAADSFCRVPPFASASSNMNINVRIVADVFSALTQQLKEYSQKGLEHSFVVSASVYAEADLLDLFYFHREARQAATRAADREGPLDLWVVDCAKAQPADLESLLTRSKGTSASYFVRDYVSRLTHPRDLRRMVSDTLGGRCEMRPAGSEIRSGVWIGEGAEIHRRARIVAPAFIGCRSKVEEDSLITRCSSIEKDCFVDCGTVIEDSSILANTHIGIWLDVCHAVAHGNRLLSLQHEVVVEISDPSIMRSNGETKTSLHLRRQDVQQQVVAGLQHEPLPAPQTCGLEPILSRGD